ASLNGRTQPRCPSPLPAVAPIPPLFFIHLSTLQTSFEIISQDLGGNFGQGDERRLPDLAFPAEFRVDEAERVQFLHVFPKLRMGPRLFAVLLAHDRVGLFRLPIVMYAFLRLFRAIDRRTSFFGTSRRPSRSS